MVVIPVLLTVLVACVWLGAWGFARLADAYSRLHCVTFITVAGGLALVATTFAADGLSDRSGKVCLLAVTLLVSGAAVTHATGRALAYREAGGEQPRADEA